MRKGNHSDTEEIATCGGIVLPAKEAALHETGRKCP